MSSNSNFSLASWKTQSREHELRANQRSVVSGWSATLFTAAGSSVSGTVVDSSLTGVSLVIAQGGIDIDVDVELTLNLNTGQRRFTRIARVCWLDRSAGDVHFGVQFVDHTGLTPETHQLDISAIRIDPACALRIPAGIAVRRKLLPFLDLHGVIQVACADIKNITVLNSVSRMLKAPIRSWPVDAKALEQVLKDVYGNTVHQAAVKPVAKQKEDAGNAAIDLAEGLLYSAFIRQASDIHVDPHVKGARIRFRVDGQLEVFDEIKTDIYQDLASRLKVISGLDIAEKRAPQDGRFTHKFTGSNQQVDIRAATLPTKYGERITMRLLATQNDSLTLVNLGFIEYHQLMIEQFLSRIQGMMVLTGPTGSGKTTTLYAAMTKLLRERQVNIMTVEDPIEYEIPGAAQCEIDSNSDKVSFNSALRSILRHDPDVVMVGEIRDKETADIAIKAALTGHMVLSTLHTNSAIATITRLIDMGVPAYLVAAALRVVIAQRLLRRLCGHCSIARPLLAVEAIAIDRKDLEGTRVYEPVGCVYCGNKGFKGRIGLYEVVELRTEWARVIAEGGSESDLLAMMHAEGINSLLDDAVDKMLLGKTSYSEVMQVASSW
ncbi:hypothetical protein AU255_04780 [Methyloprofundus sedimenti]|uniref:Bacterial type II secretion system protein E domain-containing protein n=1 Tax=Methyloprofundus sedimenti TaxID=1420851 RepID=A0A1V8M6L2_9GAMM|nr:ATPase, T2SS/T4P/T4SS family [Methyloprofundus sedimenti]OQK17211.1 hypothetical protein AU255_04780 [Methyloprofundus sedimenti]